jgi:hypothetical protein
MERVMNIDQKDLDKLNVDFVCATKNYTLSQRDFLMRQYAQNLSEGGVAQTQSWLRTVEAAGLRL